MNLASVLFRITEEYEVGEYLDSEVDSNIHRKFNRTKVVDRIMLWELSHSENKTSQGQISFGHEVT